MLNATKTKYILIKPQSNKSTDDHHNIYINGTILTKVGNAFSEKATKFLGISIDESLTWKHHIKNVNNKISRSLFMIKQVKHILPYTCLRTLYFSLIHPYIYYGISAWGNAGSTALSRTITLKKRAIRIIQNAPYNSHTDPLFKKACILKVRDIYEYEIVLFMYKYNAIPFLGPLLACLNIIVKSSPILVAHGNQTLCTFR